MKKKPILIGCISTFVFAVVLIIILIKFVFNLTSGITDTAKEFFTCLQQKDHSNAYSLLSEEFRSKTSEKEFKEFTDNSSLTDYESTEWDNRSIANDRGTLDGKIKTKNGGSIPIKIDLINENNKWKIFSIEIPASGIIEQKSALSIPDDEELINLVKASMHSFALAVNKKDFCDFHLSLSQHFQNQFSPEKLRETFKSFSDQNLDLTVLDYLQPIFDEPAKINEEEILVLNGHYATSPSKIFLD